MITAAWKRLKGLPSRLRPRDAAPTVAVPVKKAPAFDIKNVPLRPAPPIEGLMIGEIGIEGAAEQLIALGVTRAIFVSPEGDEAAASSVSVARAIADAGLRVLLLDLTSSGAATRPMLETLAASGITNLLSSEAQFIDVIHQDRYSDCDIIPVGTADAARAMRAADRLPIIMQSLTTAYDIVLVECGPADAAAIRRLVTEDTEILVSMIDPVEMVETAAQQLVEGGYERLTIVSPVESGLPGEPLRDRTAA